MVFENSRLLSIAIAKSCQMASFLAPSHALCSPLSKTLANIQNNRGTCRYQAVKRGPMANTAEELCLDGV